MQKSAIRILPVFDVLQKTGNIPERDMFNTFNMGVGMVAVVSKEEADKALHSLKQSGEDAYIVGEVVKGEEEIVIC